MSKELITAFEETMDGFQQQFAAFSQEQVNLVPFEGSWTPAQVMVHILKSQAKLPELLSGEKAAANREPGKNIELLKSIFLDFSTKLQSPDFILPPAEVQDKEQLMLKVSERKHAIVAAIETSDLNKLCVGFELPQMGLLTGLEWIWFVVFHVKRHTHQLEKMYAAVNAVASSTLEKGSIG